MAYMSVFPASVWMLVLCLVILMAILFNFMGHAQSEIDRLSISNGFFFSLILLVQMSLDDLFSASTSSTSGKVAFLNYAMTTLILYNYYTSEITAVLTAGKSVSSIRSFQVLKKMLPAKVCDT